MFAHRQLTDMCGPLYRQPSSVSSFPGLKTGQSPSPQFITCQAEQTGYQLYSSAWKAASATPVCSMPKSACAALTAASVILPKSPSALPVR